MRTSQQVKYAIYGVFDLAYHGCERPVPIQEIGERQEIPPRYLEQIFQKLRRAGLVESKRGPGGGYLLARDPERISLADVVLAVQGEVLLLSEDDEAVPPESPGFVWERIRGGLERLLARSSVADLCREAARRGVGRAEAGPAMYEI